jgi:hypothetical protein
MKTVLRNLPRCVLEKESETTRGFDKLLQPGNTKNKGRTVRSRRSRAHGACFASCALLSNVARSKFMSKYHGARTTWPFEPIGNCFQKYFKLGQESIRPHCINFIFTTTRDRCDRLVVRHDRLQYRTTAEEALPSATSADSNKKNCRKYKEVLMDVITNCNCK